MRWLLENEFAYRIFVWIGALLTAVLPGLFFSRLFSLMVMAFAAWCVPYHDTSVLFAIDETNSQWEFAFLCGVMSGGLLGMFYYNIILQEVFPSAWWWIWLSAVITALLYVGLVVTYGRY